MSLFATLVARAQGEAATAQPRHRSLFEQVDTDLDATDEAIDDGDETPEPAQRFTQAHEAVVFPGADRPQQISPVDSLLSTESTPPRREVSDPRVQSSVSTSPTPPPQAVNDPPMRAFSAPDHRTAPNDPTLPRVRNVRGPPAALNERSADNLDRRGDRTEASPTSSPDAGRSFPITTELPRPTAAGHDSGRDDQASMHQDGQPTPLVEVHIGTIEVVAKAPPAPRAAPPPRPLAARISLDDYRRQA